MKTLIGIDGARTDSFSMKTLIVVGTCPRGEFYYLGDTVDGLIETGAGEADFVIVVSDGPIDAAARSSLPNKWGYEINVEGGRGSQHVFWQALALAVEEDAERLLWFEDDLAFCRNAVRRMLASEVPEDLALISFFDMATCAANAPDGLYTAPVLGTTGQGFRGSQALLLPRRTIEYLYNHERAVVGGTEKNGLDRAIGQTLAAAPAELKLGRYGIHLPCLVEHVGGVSAAHPGETLDRPRGPWQRIATRWLGKDFDALTLPNPLPLRHIDIDPGAEGRAKRFDERGLPLAYGGAPRTAEIGDLFRTTCKLIEDEKDDPAALEEAVLEFRERAPRDVWAVERAWVALQLADAFLAEHDFDLARTWSLRALADEPRVDAFCLLGEIAEAEGRLREAISWYEAADSTPLPPYAETPGVPPHTHRRQDLIESRAARLWRLRQKHLDRFGGHVQPVRRGRTDMVMAVMTAPRSDSMLERTLASLSHAGLERWKGPKLIVSDGCAPQVPGWETFGSTEVLGSMRTLLRLLCIMVAEYPNHTLLSFQDDVVLPRNGLDYIARTIVPDGVALLSWFSMFDLPVRGPALGVFPLPLFDCGQGITVPPTTIATVVASGVAETWPRKHGCDRLFGAAMPDALYAIHYPNLVQHIGGLNSAMGNEYLGARMSPSFIGEDADTNLTVSE